jgi:hypothetical protein
VGRKEPTKKSAMATRTPPAEPNPTRRSLMLWLLVALSIFALLAGFALALDWIDPERSRLF